MMCAQHPLHVPSRFCSLHGIGHDSQEVSAAGLDRIASAMTILSYNICIVWTHLAFALTWLQLKRTQACSAALQVCLMIRGHSA